MADISIEEAKAKIWMDDVNAELEAVEGVLKKVNGVVTSVAGDDDSIMQGIYQVAVSMDGVWTKMCSAFKNSQEKLAQALSKIVESATSVIDDASTLKSKFGQ